MTQCGESDPNDEGNLASGIRSLHRMRSKRVFNEKGIFAWLSEPIGKEAIHTVGKLCAVRT